jgi:hypothetical protein
VRGIFFLPNGTIWIHDAEQGASDDETEKSAQKRTKQKQSGRGKEANGAKWFRGTCPVVSHEESFYVNRTWGSAMPITAVSISFDYQ